MMSNKNKQLTKKQSRNIKSTKGLARIETDYTTLPYTRIPETCTSREESNDNPAQSILNAAVKNTIFYRSISRPKVQHVNAVPKSQIYSKINPCEYEIALLKSMECDGILTVIKNIKGKEITENIEKTGLEIKKACEKDDIVNYCGDHPASSQKKIDNPDANPTNKIEEFKGMEERESKKSSPILENQVCEDRKNESVTSIEAVLIDGIKSKKHSSEFSFEKTNESVGNSSKRFHEMVSCPYIQRIKETSQKYREVVTQLHALAQYNDEMKCILKADSVADKEAYDKVLKKNRSIRVLIKTNLSEMQGGNKENSNAAKKQSKRELIKIRDVLLEENEQLMLEIKRKCLM